MYISLLYFSYACVFLVFSDTTATEGETEVNPARGDGECPKKIKRR